jgi:hypothetical protein
MNISHLPNFQAHRQDLLLGLWRTAVNHREEGRSAPGAWMKKYEFEAEIAPQESHRFREKQVAEMA